jgi:hypothetical protein
MNYVIIGEPCIDVIHLVSRPGENAKTINSFGGILYSVISLSVLSDNQDKIIPVFNIGNDEYDNVIKLLGSYPNISIEGISSVDDPTRRVNLYYNLFNTGKTEKLETSTPPVREIEYQWIGNFIKDADAILINMISGVDIDLVTFKKIRENFPGFIHIDIHNLVMKRSEDGSRYHVYPGDWLQWCTNSDTVQMNEYEAKTIGAKLKNEYRIAEEILINSNAGVKGIIITKGIDGVTGFTKKEKFFDGNTFYDLDRYDLGAVENPNFLDSTGCGDVFASAFVRDFSSNKDFNKSLHFANRIASLKSSLEGISGLDKLR